MLIFLELEGGKQYLNLRKQFRKAFEICTSEGLKTCSKEESLKGSG